MGTAVRTAKTSPASWDAFRDIDAFVDEVLAELAAMAADGTQPTRSPGRSRHWPERRCARRSWRSGVCAFCGMQWRAIGQLCDIPFNTLYTLFARWTRLGLWRRLLDRLRRTWRLACGDTAEPSAVVDRQPLLPLGTELLHARHRWRQEDPRRQDPPRVDKYGIPLAIDVSPANTHDTKGIVPVLRELAGQGFRGSALGDLGYRGKRLAKAGQKLGITVKAVARGRDGKFLPTGILLGGGSSLYANDKSGRARSQELVGST